MLACIQRRQNLSSQHLTCVPKSLDVLTPPLLLPAPPPPPQPRTRKGESPSAASRYPSPAELDAFAKKTASSPLCIKIFPSDIRVPQHKQLSKTVNGLDTTGQSYSPYSQPYSGGYRGLLAIGKAAAVKGVLKNSEGKRTKQAHSQACLTPYKNPVNGGFAIRPGHKAYHVNSCKPDVPAETLCSRGDHGLLPRSELAEVQSLMRQLNRVTRAGGEARPSPSLQAVAAVAHSDFGAGIPPTQSSMAFGGAVVPTQSAARVARADYAAWQHRHQVYQQGATRMYNLDSGVAQSPESCLPPLASSTYGVHQPMQGHFSVRHFFTPLWDGLTATPNSDCYASQVPGTMAPPHPGFHHQTHFHPPPLPVPVHPQVYGTEQTACCGPPSSSLCHAAALSRSLQSLECLISEIQPPCIKERMLGRGYEAVGTQQMLEQQQQQQPHHSHHPHAHIQLPVYR
ncbi:protein FAM222A isoform X1 [Syngnathus typhle]|uniref:protein FAM222A isoform X1 n=1 Tax=Syngnathus typhle TaxID=161592 RepID=UPI002A69C865|nr:protein FAM222A isoform X1 [Syngnathus typhle]XP_061149560.1 protein FAM222A isoform X1 [Syngnathus typhle]